LIEKRPFFGSKKREKFSKNNEKIAQNGKSEQKIGVFCKDFSLHTFLDCAITTKNRFFSFQNSIFSRQKFRKIFREISHFKIANFEPEKIKKRQTKRERGQFLILSPKIGLIAGESYKERDAEWSNSTSL